MSPPGDQRVVAAPITRLVLRAPNHHGRIPSAIGPDINAAAVETLHAHGFTEPEFSDHMTPTFVSWMRMSFQATGDLCKLIASRHAVISVARSAA